MSYSRFLISIILGILFLIIEIISLPNYGPNWDEPVHFGRGQAILHYFLTGKKDYKDLSQKKDIRRSYYQSDGYTYAFFESQFNEKRQFVIGGGHPVLSDIFASIFNRVFYKTLNLIGDVESYHLYSITLASILVGVLYFLMSSIYGVFIGLLSVLALVLTPLFLGESRFNIKDIPEMIFYSFTILSFFRGIVKNNWQWIVLSSFLAGLAFSTKFNIIFGIFSIGIWLIYIFVGEISKKGWLVFFKMRWQIIITLFFYPIIPLIIYFGSWPILWKDPIGRFLYNLNYYKNIGTGGSPSEFNTLFRINTYAIQWILFSTPLIILMFASVGILSGILSKRNKSFFLLIIIWFFMPIVRVSMPSASIYGGVRQIIEYIPAMAILAGIGANQILNLLLVCFAVWKKKYFRNVTTKNVNFLLQVLLISLFIPITVKLFFLYPNESVYFNPLIGGFKGAATRNLPWWGNTLGSTYRQGVRWLNSNAEKNSKLGFIYELRSNIPQTDLRSDIEFSNQLRSGMQRKGEYIIGVTHESTQENAYHRKYLETVLNPIYTLDIEGISVLKIWKNDILHSKIEFQKTEEVISDPLVIKEKGNLIIDLKEQKKITKIVIHYPDKSTCSKPINGYFQHSLDRIKWKRETADFLFFPLANWFKTQPESGILQFLFAAEQARFIRLVILDKNSCLLEQPLKVEVSVI